MKHILQVNTQGIRGSKPKAENKGWAMLHLSSKGHALMQLSADTFEGEGKDYKERENIEIDIYFPSTGGLRWRGSIAELKAVLFPNT